MLSAQVPISKAQIWMQKLKESRTKIESSAAVYLRMKTIAHC
jgi:hypothetical protein